MRPPHPGSARSAPRPVALTPVRRRLRHADGDASLARCDPRSGSWRTRDPGWPAPGRTPCGSHTAGVFAGQVWSEWRRPRGPEGRPRVGEPAQPVLPCWLCRRGGWAGARFPSFVNHVRGSRGLPPERPRCPLTWHSLTPPRPHRPALPASTLGGERAQVPRVPRVPRARPRPGTGVGWVGAHARAEGAERDRTPAAPSGLGQGVGAGVPEAGASTCRARPGASTRRLSLRPSPGPSAPQPVGGIGVPTTLAIRACSQVGNHGRSLAPLPPPPRVPPQSRGRPKGRSHRPRQFSLVLPASSSTRRTQCTSPGPGTCSRPRGMSWLSTSTCGRPPGRSSSPRRAGGAPRASPLAGPSPTT